jgi:hypothetical protein
VKNFCCLLQALFAGASKSFTWLASTINAFHAHLCRIFFDTESVLEDRVHMFIFTHGPRQQRLPIEGEREGGTIVLKAFGREGNQWYTVSVADKTCDCPVFETRQRCQHLSALAIHRLRPFTRTSHPTFSQALSGLVKSIRVRRLEDAVYWLLYLDNFEGRQHRFRTARRLLIGSAEDGHSIAVMENVSARFRKTSKCGTELSELVADAVSICNLPNWWHPASGGPDYIYQSLVGQRAWWYKEWDYTAETLRKQIQAAIDDRNKALAVGGVIAFADVQETFGTTKQAEFLLQLAESMGQELAVRLCQVHLTAKSALSGDNNFLCQAAWLLAGGVSPVADTFVPATAESCADLLRRARDRWRNPEPIPRWCLDGVHSAGDDPRFMVCLPEMWAVCRAFQHYGRVDPNDHWLPEFQCHDGLVIACD